MNNSVWIIIAFGFYLLIMMGIGFYSFKKTSSTEDYFLGGRSLGAWVAALSAQASDMSGWLLMGLPGAIYAAGTGEIWIAVGLLIGTALNWIFVATRLRRYTIQAKNALTLPEFFENRFNDKTKLLKIISAIFIAVFFLAYTASAFASGAKLFSAVFGIEYTVALAIGAVVILVYTFLGGYLAVCWTDFIQGFLMLVTLLVVPVIVVCLMGGTAESKAILDSLGTNFLNPFYDNGEPLTFVGIISQLAWALGYFGMPHILVRFMSIKSEAEVKKSRVIGIGWVVISLAASCFVGIIGRGFFAETGIADSENIFIEMINKVFTVDFNLAFIGGILLCGILAAIMSTADSQLLVTASAVSEDIYKGIINKKASEKSMLIVSRITVLVISAIAFVIALNPKSSIMGLVSVAWAGLGATFGPIVLFSLFWRRSNLAGAVSAMATGGITVLIWEYLPFAGNTLYAMTGLYSIVPGFFFGSVMMVVVSLLTKKPSDEILADFDKVKSGEING